MNAHLMLKLEKANTWITCTQSKNTTVRWKVGLSHDLENEHWS